MAVDGKQILNGSIAEAKLSSSFLATLIRTDGANAFTADQSMGGFNLTNLASPVGANDAATKSYVDALVAYGASWKSAVRAASTGNLTLSGEQTVDGIALVAGDRVLAKNQTDPIENGIYVVASGAWTRAVDCDETAEMNGAAVFVLQGSVNADRAYIQTADDVVVDTDAVTWVQFDSGAVVAGNGLTQSGNTINVVAGDNSLTVNADDLIVKRDGSGAVGLTASGIKVNVDGSSIEINTNALRIKASGVTDAMLQTSYIKADGTRPFTGDQSMGGNKLTNVATPVAGTDAANKNYVDSAVSAASGSVLTSDDKEKTPAATSGNDQDTTLTITNTPADDSYVIVMVNGIAYTVGNGVKTKDCYFTNDNGTTARSIANIAAGDKFYWNGTIAGFDLATSDRVDFNYNF